MANRPPSVTANSPRRLGRALSAPWIDRIRTARLFDGDSWSGLLGRRISLPFAYVWCFLVSWPVSIVEFAGVPLMLATLARLHRNYRLIPSILFQPLVLGVVVFGAVQYCSLAWSLDRSEGLAQAGSIRWLWSLFLLWPFIDHRRSLIMVLAAGFLVGNASQVYQYLHVHMQWQAPTWHRAPDRYSGWWPPVIAGSVLTAALGLHLPAAFLPGPLRTRALAGLASLVTLAGIFATGTRGAWLAAAALVPLVAVACAIIGRGSAAPEHDRLERRGKSRWPIPAVLAVAVIAAAVSWVWIGESVSRRVFLARQEITAAIKHGDFTSDTGARIWMAGAAVGVFRDHAWIGAGAGSYREAAISRSRAHAGAGDDIAPFVHEHAHNSILHIAATTGVLGLAPAVLVVVVAFRNAAYLGRSRWRSSGAYEWGPAGALAGMLLVSLFDPVHLNAQTSAVLAVLLSLCPSFVPGVSAVRPSDP